MSQIVESTSRVDAQLASSKAPFAFRSESLGVSSRIGFDVRHYQQSWHCQRLLMVVMIAVLFSGDFHGQTASTGALTGIIFDPTGAFTPGVLVRITNEETG